jgi:hypothetical protein
VVIDKLKIKFSKNSKNLKLHSEHTPWVFILIDRIKICLLNILVIILSVLEQIIKRIQEIQASLQIMFNKINCKISINTWESNKIWIFKSKQVLMRKKVLIVVKRIMIHLASKIIKQGKLSPNIMSNMIKKCIHF